MSHIMKAGSTTPVKSLPQVNSCSPKFHRTQAQAENIPVSFQAVGCICTAEQNTTPTGGDQQDSKQKIQAKSELLVDSTSGRPISGSPRRVYVPNIHSVDFIIDKNTVSGDESNDGNCNDEYCEFQGPAPCGSQDNSISPIKFVRKWAKNRLPNDESSAQLRRKLSAVAAKNHLQQKFIPDDMLKRIITAETVCTELENSNYSNIRRIHASPVTVEDGSKYQKILAILYLIKLPSKIRKFVKHGVCDKDLPLIACESSKYGSSNELRSRGGPTVRVIRFKRQEHIYDFLDTQWKVLAPVFQWTNGDRIWHRRLVSETIIPFISHGSTISQGGYSKVFKTEIYPTHHEFGNGNIFAVKVLRECDQKAFKQEAAILGRLSNTQHIHKHLINLLATFEHGEVFHFIFPWADADLFTFWKRQSDPPIGEKMETWIIEQCHGLAEALNTIHRYETMSGTTLFETDHAYKQDDDKKEQKTIQFEISDIKHSRHLFGRHGDLKPENILWFPCSTSTGGHGVLKITDFGAARFNTVNLWDTHKTGRIPNSPTYRSPEIDLHGRLTTACDVWALGCVYLQFITWFCGGNSRLQDFGQRRLAHDPKFNMPTDTFFSIIKEGDRMRATVKHAVIDEIEKLRNHSRCTKDCKTLLNIVQEDMLVVHQQEASSQEITSPEIGIFSDSKTCDGQNSITTRRKSCGNILRRIGDIQPANDQEGNFMRHNTFESTLSSADNTSFWLSKNNLSTTFNATEVSSYN